MKTTGSPMVFTSWPEEIQHPFFPTAFALAQMLNLIDYENSQPMNGRDPGHVRKQFINCLAPFDVMIEMMRSMQGIHCVKEGDT